MFCEKLDLPRFINRSLIFGLSWRVYVGVGGGGGGSRRRRSQL